MNYHKRKLRKEDKKEWKFCDKQYEVWSDMACNFMDKDNNYDELSVIMGFMNLYGNQMVYYERHVKG